MFLGRLDGRCLGQMDEALAILREHAPEGLDAGFEHNPVASDSLRYVLERSPAECADALPPPSPRHHALPSPSPSPHPSPSPRPNPRPSCGAWRAAVSWP